MADRTVTTRLKLSITDWKAGSTTVKRDLKDLNRQFAESSGFASGFRKKLEDAVARLPKIEIDANSGPAEVKMAQLRDEMESLSKKTIGVDIDATDALTQMARIQGELEALEEGASFEVRASVQQALRDLRDVDDEARRLEGRHVRLNIDTSALERSASGLGSMFEQSLGVIGKAGPANVAVVVGAIQALPTVAGLAAAGIVSAVGGALTAVGVTAAAQSDKVRHAWSELGSDLKRELGDIAEPFEGSLLRAADVAQDAFAKLKPSLARIFADLVPDVDAFIRAVGDGIATLGPHLERMGDGFGKVLRSLSDQMPQIMDNVGEAFDTFSDILDEDPQMLANLVTDATELLAIGAEVLSWADEIKAALTLPLGGRDAGNLAFEYMFGTTPEQLAEDMQSVPAMFDAVNGAMAAAAEASRGLGDGAGAAEGGIRNLSSALEEFYDPAQKALDAEIRLKQAIQEADQAAKNQKMTEIERLQGVQNVTSAISEAAKAEMERTGGTKAATQAFQENIGRLTQWAGSNSAAKGAIDGLAQSLGITIARTKDGTVAIDRFGNAVKILPNGKRVEIDANTAKGKAELSAFLLHIARQRGTVDVHVRTIYDSPSGRRAVEQKNRAMGGIERYAAGGVRSSGGGRMSPPPHITSEPRILYGEGSGDEAFIPYDPRYRARAIEILGTVANEFGLQVFNREAEQKVSTLSTGLGVSATSITGSVDAATQELRDTMGEAGTLTSSISEVGAVGEQVAKVWGAGSAALGDEVSGLSEVVGISADMIVWSADNLANAAVQVADAIASAAGSSNTGQGGKGNSSTKKRAAKTVDENSIAGHYGGSYIRGDSGLSNTARVSAPQQAPRSSYPPPAGGGGSSASASAGDGFAPAGGKSVVFNNTTVRESVDVDVMTAQIAAVLDNRG